MGLTLERDCQKRQLADRRDDDIRVQKSCLAIVRSLSLLRQTYGQAEQTAYLRALATGVCYSWDAARWRAEHLEMPSLSTGDSEE